MMEGRTQRRWITGGGSYQSVDEPSARFGFGGLDVEAGVSVTVRWPDGARSRMNGVPTGRTIVVEPPQGSL